MKNLLILAVAFSLFSCSTTELVHLSVMEPAPVTLPPSIKTVGIVNRSQASKQTKVIDVVDKIFSLEGANLDFEGAKSSMSGLSDELMKNSRFSEVKLLSAVELRTIGAGTFPTPLPWDEVDKICRDNHVDALFALETFDTDSKINYAVSPTSIRTPLGNVPAVEQQASMLTTVKTGWRIYDPAGRNILDEFPISRSIAHSSSGINPAVAAAALVGRKDAVKEVGDKIGHVYACRIIPYWLRVSRDYFVRGSDQFRVARRKAQTGNWNEAAQLWQQETNNPDGKVAGRACYNMAIISEINGELDAAIGWAQKSYENYNNRLGLIYVNILKNRKVSMDLVQEQQ
ncbi:MAG TPA: DUF6340 family protein [Puia sp.]|nr:DUF6340 family protein [Puia sp.]